MNIIAHFRSLSAEFAALQDRVRNIIADQHWQTHGEWRESILRSVLRRYLPQTVEVGRGFITDGRSCSTQIDVLIYDRAVPLLYRDHDLVIVTPDAVQGIIEVKSRVRRGDIATAVAALVRNGQLAARREGEPHRPSPLLGLFSYEFDAGPTRPPSWVLRELVDVASELGGTVSQLCLDPSHFVHFWERRPETWADWGYNQWHLYDLDQLAPGYFVHNIVHHVAGNSVLQNFAAWFPDQTKELHVIDRAQFPQPTTEA